jgi:hypothetical protein
MGTRFRIDLSHRVVIAEGWGILDAREIVASACEQCAHPDFEPDRNILWDLRRARLLVDYADIKPLIADLDQLPTRSVSHRVAWVVSSELTEMLTRLFNRLSEDGPVTYSSFDSLESALAWVGLPKDFEVSVDDS